MNNNDKPKSFSFKIYENGMTIYKCDTSKYDRFLNQTRQINWKKGIVVYLRVSYKGYKKSYNDMDCFSKDDLNWGIKAFATEFLQ